MSQDNLIKLESEGLEDTGAGKGHIIYSTKNPRNKKRLRLRKFNPVVKAHTWYKETK